MLNYGLNGFTEKTIPYLSLVGGKGRTFGVGGITWCFRGTEGRSVAAMRGGYGKLTVN